MFSGGKAGARRSGDADTDAAIPKLGEGSSAGADSRREHPGSDTQLRKEVAEKARWLLPFPERGCPGSVGREELAPGGPRLLQSV